MTHPPRPTFLYDSDCGVCIRFKRIVSFFDSKRRVDFLPIDEGARLGYLAAVPTNELYSSSRLVLPDGTISSGGDGVVGLLGKVSGGKIPAFILTKVPIGIPLARLAYGIVSRLHGSSCGSTATGSIHPIISLEWTLQ